MDHAFTSTMSWASANIALQTLFFYGTFSPIWPLRQVFVSRNRLKASDLLVCGVYAGKKWIIRSTNVIVSFISRSLNRSTSLVASGNPLRWPCRHHIECVGYQNSEICSHFYYVRVLLMSQPLASDDRVSWKAQISARRAVESSLVFPVRVQIFSVYLFWRRPCPGPVLPRRRKHFSEALDTLTRSSL